MAFDIDKIIQESFKAESSPIQTSNILTEQEDITIADEENNFNSFSSAIGPAITAGLGALMLRNKLRSINELDLESLASGAGKVIKKGAEFVGDKAKIIGKYAKKAYGQAKVGDWDDAGDYLKKGAKKIIS